MKIKIGVICPSEIAFRRFLPALKKNENFEYIGVAIANKQEWFGEKKDNIVDYLFDDIRLSEEIKAQSFVENYGGKIFNSYEQMIVSKEVDAVYLPLPPALHFKWAKMALEHHLHVLVEKPSTTSLADTKELVELAKKNDLALHENYMFMYHSQIQVIDDVIKSGKIGEVRLYRVDFGFPNRGKQDFRYNKALGGGALLDCGGYTLKYANYLLGGNAKIQTSNLMHKKGYEVDIAGSATLVNKQGQVAQVSFGMDNDYRCSVEVWGSLGTLKSGRILTAPDGFEPSYEVSINGKTEGFKMSSDDAFCKSIQRFYECIIHTHKRFENYEILIKQEYLVEGVR